MFKAKAVEVEVVIGDTIRSYDFKPMAGRVDCFVEGEVLDINNNQGYMAYEVVVTKDSWSDAECKGRLGKVVYCPVEVSFSEYAGRIINLSRL